MYNPERFPEPEIFKPDRFLKDGEFIHDMHVCGFSLGLRNCIGKKLAQLEYFTFASDIINKYRIERVAGTLEPARHQAILRPKDDIRVRFLPR